MDVPRELQTPRLKAESDRAFGWNIEEHFCEWATHNEVPDSYLPIFWWNNAAAGYLVRHGGPFFAVPEVQAFVDALPPGQYFTVSRGADGPYEKLPSNITVFSAGGRGHFPIPHLAEIEHAMNALDRPRNLLVSFVGNIECGGPEVPRPIGRSSWNPDGVGAQLRRQMVTVFRNEPDCLVKSQVVQAWTGDGLAAHEDFCDIAKRSWFGLAPRGYGATSYRLYEMIMLGTIPVYIYDDPWLPYLDQLDWTEFAVLCHVSKMDGLPGRLRNIPEDQRRRMIARGQELLPNYFTPDAVCQQILRYVSLL